MRKALPRSQNLLSYVASGSISMFNAEARILDIFVDNSRVHWGSINIHINAVVMQARKARLKKYSESLPQGSNASAHHYRDSDR